VIDELEEQAYAGTGIISSLWLKHCQGIGSGRADAPLFGVRYKLQLLGNFHIIIAFVPSPITDNKGTTTANGKENRIEALPNTPIDG
jgi:hypothetical protein